MDERALEAEAIRRVLLHDPRARREPHPWYDRLRALAPVHVAPGGRTVTLTRYADCAAALRDPRLRGDFAARSERRLGPGWRVHPALAGAEAWLQHLEGPEHAHRRSWLSQAFAPGRIDALRPLVVRHAEALVAPFVDAGGGDLLPAVAYPLPLRVVGALLGLPAAEADALAGPVRALETALESDVSPGRLALADLAAIALRRRLTERVDAFAPGPGGPLAALVAGVGGDPPPTHEARVALAMQLLVAGVSTTANAIGNGLVGLLLQAGALARLREDPLRVEKLPDELLRHDGPIQLAVRVAREDVPLREHTIPAGACVEVLIGAANRDPAVFRDPERIDPDRAQPAPLGFGAGTHLCLGGSLARLLIGVALRTLLCRCAALELCEVPRFRADLERRGLESLPLHASRAPARSTRMATALLA